MPLGDQRKQAGEEDSEVGTLVGKGFFSVPVTFSLQGV
jgi:hypothetical protein